MPKYALRLQAPKSATEPEVASSFYWLSDSASSFRTQLGPSLGTLGPVALLNIDFARIAVGVYAADRSTPRRGGRSDWNQRRIELSIPVSKPGKWRANVKQLEQVIGFLTGDLWTLKFVKDVGPAETARVVTGNVERVVLLSGGADSAVGALMSRDNLDSSAQHILLSHFSAHFLAPIQRAIALEAERLLPGPVQSHEVLQLSRKTARIDGTSFGKEFSTRSRSLLFLALGLAAGSVYNAPLWIPENGFASLNPPLGHERLGSLSTRTTHPAFLSGLSDVLGKVGAHAEIVNPFSAMTKGEMFGLAIELVGKKKASAYLSGTHSCGLTGQRGIGIAPRVQCGVCFGCVVRRASFSAVKLKDHTDYIDPGHSTAAARWLNENSITQQARNLVDRGVGAKDVAAMGLPLDYPMSKAVGLCQRGLVELGTVV